MASGPNGQLMVGLIPELELLIGKQPPIPDLPPQDAQNRFQIVFLRFLGVFARPLTPSFCSWTYCNGWIQPL